MPLRRFTLLSVALLALFASLPIACGGDDDEDAGEPEDGAGQPTTLQVTMRDIAYSVSAITATEDQPVHIDLENQGQLTHDFTIDGIEVDDLHTEGGSASEEHAPEASEHDVHLALDPGGTGRVEFAPVNTGTYEYYCTVAGHREAGMRGTLTVE